jgi:hypothetical protein
MRVLVDYDNIPVTIRRQGLLHLADRIFEAVRPLFLDDFRLDLRLYGGWYEDDKLTRRAQELSVELSDFPYPLWLKDRTPAQLVPIGASLAQSLEALPKKLLHATYRKRPPPRRFSCEDPSTNGCANNPCPISSFAAFINTEQCPTPGCRITPKALLRGVGEQKLVDSMLVSDMIHLSRQDAAVVIVTSDDDVWPGMINALVNGTRVIHVRTGNESGQTNYSRDLPGRYECRSL